jgi:PAS domain S-box-containing protein
MAREPPAADAAYRSIFDNAVLGIFRTTPAGRLIAANRALARIYGYSSVEEMLAKLTDVRRQVYVDRRRRAEMDGLLLQKGSVSGFEAEVYRKDRSRIWISVSARAVRHQGGIQYYEGTVEDVTEHKRVEAELRRQNEMLQTIFDHMPLMFNVLGPDGVPVMVNREWTRVLGWTARDLEGRDLLGRVYQDASERRRARHFIEAADRRWGDFRVRVRDGHFVDTTWANFRLSDGTLIGIGQDITEREQVQRALRARARQQAAVAGVGQDALEGQDLDAVFAKAARLVSDTLECDGCGIWRLQPGRRCLLLVAGVGWAPDETGTTGVPVDTGSLVGYAVKTGRPVVVRDLRVEKRLRLPLLRARGAVSAAATLIGTGEDPLGVLQVFARQPRVFTEDDVHFLQAMAHMLATAIIRKRQEEIRHQLLARVMWAQEEERRRIARELHDETGQALTSLLVRLRALEDSRSLRGTLARASGLRRLAARTIDDLGRLARGLSPSVLENLGIRPALERLASEQSASLGVRVEVDTRRLGTGRVPADAETALYRIAQEAVANAARHGSPRRIGITVERANGTVSLIVKDDGRGFDPAAVLRAAAGKGRLGLHGMRERAALLGGSLQLVSARGAGTTVSVRVPIRPPSRPAGGSARDGPRRVGTGRRR